PRQDPLGEAGVIAIFSNKLAEGQRPTVFGDGKQTRDYVFVADVVDANLRASEADAGGAFNIGTETETSVLELVDFIGRHGGGASFEPLFEPPRPGEVDRSCLDTSRARAELGWQPQLGVEEGIAATLRDAPG
ncbi:MAG: GDP-mannose 4,6-dehydratase, partial [Actinomycetota bacterium]